jgi:phosphomannomutase
MEHLKSQLKDYELIDNDVKINGPDWFVLAHPSNTEPIIRIISEARTTKKAQELVDWFTSLCESH